MGIGEAQALFRHAIDVWGRGQPTGMRDIPHPLIIREDEDDVGRLILGDGRVSALGSRLAMGLRDKKG